MHPSSKRSKKTKATQSKPIRDGPYTSSVSPQKDEVAPATTSADQSLTGANAARVAKMETIPPFAKFAENGVKEKFAVGTWEHTVLLIAKKDPSWSELNDLAIPEILISMMHLPRLPDLPSLPELLKIQKESPELYSVLVQERNTRERQDNYEKARAAKNVADYIEGTLLPQWRCPYSLDGPASNVSLQSLINSWFALGCLTIWRTLTGIKADSSSVYDEICACAGHRVLWDPNSGEAAYNSIMTHVLKRLEDCSKTLPRCVNDIDRFSFAVWPSCGHQGSVSAALCAYSAEPSPLIYNRSFNRSTLVTIVEYKWNVSLSPLNRANYIGQGLQYAARYLEMAPRDPQATNSEHVLQLRVLVACVIPGKDGQIAFSMNKAILDFRKNDRHEIIIDPMQYVVDTEGFTTALIERWDLGESVDPIEGIETPCP